VPGPAARAARGRRGVFWYDLANVAGRKFLSVWALLLGAGCESDAGEICARLRECHLLPEVAATKSDPEGYTVGDCEDQVEQKVGKKRREQCAECVSEKECGQIKDACRSVCSPERQ
jgi:hypothetical protein